MGGRVRDLVAILVATCALVLGVNTWNGSPDPGIRLRPVNGLLYLESLGRYPSDYNYSGAEPGMVVVSMAGRTLIQLPEWQQLKSGGWVLVSPNSNLGDGSTGGDEGPIEPVPSIPTPEPTPVPATSTVTPGILPLSVSDLEDLSLATYSEMILMWPSDLDRALAPGEYPDTRSLDPSQLRQPLWNSSASVLLGLALLIAGAIWLVSGQAGQSLATLAIPLATAVSVPLILLPAQLSLSPLAGGAVAILLALAMLPLATGFRTFIEDARLRGWATWASAGAFACAVVVGLLVAADPDRPLLGSAPGLRWASLAAIALVPGVVAARPVTLASLAEAGTTSRRLVERAELLVAAVTPAIALITIIATGYVPLVLPLLAWIAVVLAGAKFTIRPLARIATRASLQRDLVVAAMEAERARLAADLHDDALQDVTMLMRRLETAGDSEGADMARTVADRLRTISGDLRLPILDDLGVGPALDWLVTRIERMSGGAVRLELADGRRPPPDVELAVFRVAQEALANAVKHGRPPIVVRYHASESGVSLSVDDAGPGIDAAAAEAAPANGHFGMLNMQQRAEQIGAILDVRRWPSGGTHVALEWRPR
jgi:signal transduction histidine kinase